MAATLNHSEYSFSPKDAHLLSVLASGLPTPPHNHSLEQPPKATGRRPTGHVDPLIIAAVTAAAGGDVTRNHYVHDYFPHALAYASCDDEVVREPNPARLHLQSQQAPRRVRLAFEAAENLARLKAVSSAAQSSIPAPLLPTTAVFPPPPPLPSLPSPTSSTPLASPIDNAPTRHASLSDPAVAKLIRHHPAPSTSSVPIPAASEKPELVIKCHVRTRVPTPHGHVFLHLYRNNLDDKEHLAFVADQAQMDAQPGEEGPEGLHFLRSQSLDSEWREGETEIERIVRGAYVGRLSAASVTPSVPDHHHQSHPPSHSHSHSHAHPHTASPSRIDGEPLPENGSSPHLQAVVDEPPLVRIHSECFTGETIGSQRCDCGEQLDEAFRLIKQEGRGIIVYLRQEGRGIGLMEKMRAYNLQDLGHDTVAANLLLGHGADLRTYDVAGAILRDFGVPEVRLLTNNPDKIEQIEKEGISVVERVAMVPRSWTASARKDRKRKERKRKGVEKAGKALLKGSEMNVVSSDDGEPNTGEEAPGEDDEDEDDEDEDGGPDSSDSDASHNLRRAGVGMIGASTTRSAELDKYLATKIKLMGHLLELPSTPPPSRSHTPRRRSSATTGSVKAPSSRSKDHPLSSSMLSEASADCGAGCECLVESAVEDGEA